MRLRGVPVLVSRSAIVALAAFSAVAALEAVPAFSAATALAPVSAVETVSALSAVASVVTITALSAITAGSIAPALARSELRDRAHGGADGQVVLQVEVGGLVGRETLGGDRGRGGFRRTTGGGASSHA